MENGAVFGLILSLIAGSFLLLCLIGIAFYVLGIYIYSKVCKRVNLPEVLAYIPVTTAYIPAIAIDEVDIFGSKFNIKFIIIIQLLTTILAIVPIIGFIFPIVALYIQYTILKAFFNKYSPISTAKCIVATIFSPYALYLFYRFGNYKEL